MKLISCRRCSWLLTLSQEGYLVKFHGGYHGDVVVLVSCSRTVTMEEFLVITLEECCYYFLLLYFVLNIVPGMSHVIALRRSYCGDHSLSCFLLLFLS
jgi:hypothetical protein